MRSLESQHWYRHGLRRSGGCTPALRFGAGGGAAGGCQCGAVGGGAGPRGVCVPPGGSEGAARAAEGSAAPLSRYGCTEVRLDGHTSTGPPKQPPALPRRPAPAPTGAKRPRCCGAAHLTKKKMKKRRVHLGGILGSTVYRGACVFPAPAPPFFVGTTEAIEKEAFAQKKRRRACRSSYKRR
jgi:hypothetical protein